MVRLPLSQHKTRLSYRNQRPFLWQKVVWTCGGWDCQSFNSLMESRAWDTASSASLFRSQQQLANAKLLVRMCVTQVWGEGSISRLWSLNETKEKLFREVSSLNLWSSSVWHFCRWREAFGLLLLRTHCCNSLQLFNWSQWKEEEISVSVEYMVKPASWYRYLSWITVQTGTVKAYVLDCVTLLKHL